MTLHLLNVPPALKTLAARLKHDADIQKSIQGISARTVAAADAFKSAMEIEGGEVLAQKLFLMKALSPNDVGITNMKSSLNAAINALQANRGCVISLQTDIHSNVESCRGRRMEHVDSLTTKKTRISNISAEIQSLDENIRIHEEEAASSEKDAVELEERRDRVKRAARKKRKSAGIGGIVGAVLAPFTGGFSLGLAAAYAGVNLNDANDCDRKAKNLRSEAESKREHVKQLRLKKGSLEGQKVSLEQETASLKTCADELSQASKDLKEVTDFLGSSIVDINNILKVFQDMESAFADALLQTDSFVIIQNAFATQPKQLRSRAQKYLDKLKSSWTQLETTLKEQCKAILN